MLEDRDRFYDRMVRDRDWDEVANTFETARRLRIVFDDILRDRDLRGARLLDAGSGGGHFSALAAERGADVTSLDVGQALLAQVASRCESRRIEGSIAELPFAANSFDLTLSTEVIEHTREPLDGVDELGRVTRPGGTVILTTPVRLWQPVVRLASTLRLRPYQGRENFVWPRAARARLEQAGVRVDRLFGFNVLPALHRGLEPLLRIADRAGSWLPSLYVNFALVGTKQSQVDEPTDQERR